MTQDDFDNLQPGDIIEGKWTLQLYELKFKMADGSWKAEIVNDYGIKVTGPSDWYLFKKVEKENKDEVCD